MKHVTQLIRSSYFSHVLRHIVLGPAYFYHSFLIVRSKKWSEDRLGRYKHSLIERLNAAYGNAVKSKSYYMGRIKSLTRLDFPFVTISVRTGGTTGSPFIFKMDRFFRRQKERAYVFDVWSQVGYKPFDNRVVFRGDIGNELISYRWFENAWIVSPSVLNKGNSTELLYKLAQIGAFYLHVYPSSLKTFVDILGEDDFCKLPIKGILAGSEAFPTSQITYFEEKLGVPICHWYGHSEYAVFAKHCKECGGFHFYPTYGRAEFVSSSEHGLAKIVATSFNNIGTVFVRYDTGDLALLDEAKCSQPFFRVAHIAGREQEFFINSEGEKVAFGPFLFGIHNKFWDQVDDIQFVQVSPGKMLLKIVKNQHSDCLWIEKYIRNRFGNVDIEFKYVDRLNKTISGKHRYFIGISN